MRERESERERERERGVGVEGEGGKRIDDRRRERRNRQSLKGRT